MPATANRRIAQKRNVVDSMRGIDCGCETRLFGHQAGDCKASDLRNDIGKKLIGVAGRLRAFEHHIGTFRLETSNPCRLGQPSYPFRTIRLSRELYKHSKISRVPY